MNRIQILDFDTELFGIKIGKLIGKKLSSEEAEKIIEYCKSKNIRCLYADLDINDFASLNIATRYGFVISDIRIVFERDLSNFKAPKKAKIDGYQIDDNIKSIDIPYLILLSKEMSCVSRFGFDEGFPMGSAEKLYKTWMLNSIKMEVADKIVIAREVNTNKPVGVVTCKKELDHGKIILVGVDKKHIRKGIATFILTHALCFFKENRLEKVTVLTQGNNISAQRLYQKSGFFTRSISIFFHLWVK